MTIIKIWILVNMAVLAFICCAKAQDGTPKERSYMARISSEINNNLACTEAAVKLEDRVKELEAKLKALEAKDAK